MPVEINRLTEGWLELESDPGLFTLLLEDFGVKGVQVDEIYDLQKPLDTPVYGFIFLFRWIEERRSRRKVIDQSHMYMKNDNVVNNIFFAQQMVPNSCATHSLLSILLNCSNIHLGDTLNRLKEHTSGMCPENKGWAIGNTPELAKAHNSHANASARRKLDKNNSISSGRYSTGEAFHFVSYVPINGHLFELDGLKPYPIDHGPWSETEEWTEKFQRVITDRLGMATEEKYNDIRFNLMAVVPDKRLAISHKLTLLKANRTIVLEVLDKMKRKKPGDEEEEEEEEVEETGDVNTSTLLCAAKPLPSDQPSPSAAPSADSKKRKLSPDDENQSDTDKKPSDKKLKQEEDNQSDNKPDKNSTDKLKQDEDNPSDNKPDKKLKQDDDNPSSDKKSSDDKPDKKSSDKPDKKSSDDKPEKKSSDKPDKKEEDSQMSEEAGEEKEVDCAVPDGDGGEKGMEGGEVKEEKTGGGDGQSEDVDKAAGKSDITDDNKVKSSESVEAEVAAGSSQNKMEVTAESDKPSTSTAPPLPSTSTDYFTPLTIQTTSTSPLTSCTSSLEDSCTSELSSAHDSPCMRAGVVGSPGMSSPGGRDMKKFVVIRVAMGTNNSSSGRSKKDGSIRKVCLEVGALPKGWEKTSKSSSHSPSSSSKGPLSPSSNKSAESPSSGGSKGLKSGGGESGSKKCESTFAPKDLQALVKNLEGEIAICEAQLRDENERRKKYKEDDSRRTHNYDQFICAFLSMLTVQGTLAHLVAQEHLTNNKTSSQASKTYQAASSCLLSLHNSHSSADNSSLGNSGGSHGHGSSNVGHRLKYKKKKK
ncbi:hypothetical protein M8J77_018278 [Diaphorina citri]|nr:hypothetical protein M8J77_018278 [Diaphorina citri]